MLTKIVLLLQVSYLISYLCCKFEMGESDYSRRANLHTNCNKEGCTILWFMFVTHDSTAFVTIEKNQFTFFTCEMPSGVGQSFILLQSVIVGAQRIVVEKRRKQNERCDLPSQMKALFLCSFSCFYHCSLLICLLIVYRVIFLVQSNFWVCFFFFLTYFFLHLQSWEYKMSTWKNLKTCRDTGQRTSAAPKPWWCEEGPRSESVCNWRADPSIPRPTLWGSKLC